MYLLRGGPGGVEGVASPPLGSFQTCLANQVNPFFIPKIILCYNITSSPNNHYKKTVANIPLLALTPYNNHPNARSIF